MFGTDGVRGVANEKLTCELAFALGKAAVRFLGKRIVIGKDTRRSGDMLEAALVAGITAMGGDAFLIGVLPTPAAALIAKNGEYDGAIVISASHNPPKYNGIKFFDGDGFKLPDSVEDEIQDYIDAGCPGEVASGEGIGMSHRLDGAKELYVSNALASVADVTERFKGLKIVVDCGFGASFESTPEALGKLGVDFIALNTQWNGDNINVGCGSTNLSQLKEAVVANGADLGIAHDGDADRLLAVDRFGNEVDGDQIEAICAIDMKQRGLLANDTIVSTVVCNLGLIKSMGERGISVATTDVGDRYVLQEMLSKGYSIGGEPSGHMIFLDYNSTGDGLITALQLIGAVVRSEKPLDELAKGMRKLPQSLVNVPVSDKESAIASPALASAIDAAKADLGDRGRILVRKSGTEELLRVTVDADDEQLASEYANRIAEAIRAL
ncbi:MAG: phosphoglucosamine mutase [bacterium]|nr:phosphoglucosamine mutase [bacterium]